MGVLRALGRLYKNEPVLFNAALAILGALVNHFVLDFDTELAIAIDGFLVVLSAAASRQEVTPVAKLNQAGIDPKLPKVQ